MTPKGNGETIERLLDSPGGSIEHSEHLGERAGLRPDAALEQLPVLGEDADLTFPLMDVDANGWPPTPAALTYATHVE
jgi:hypothetical protein